MDTPLKTPLLNNRDNVASPQYTEVQSYPKYTSRYKTLYMKDYKKKSPLSNRCYNPNTREHITENFPMNLMTNNRVIHLLRANTNHTISKVHNLKLNIQPLLETHLQENHAIK